MPYKDSQKRVAHQAMYQRLYYQDNKAGYARARKRIRSELKAIIREAKSHPCMDCEKEFPSAAPFFKFTDDPVLHQGLFKVECNHD